MDGHSSDRVERFNNLVRSLEVCGRRRLPVSSEELARMAGYGEDGRNVKSAKARMKKDIERLNEDFHFDIDFDKKQKGYIVSFWGNYVLHKYLGGCSERGTSGESSLPKSACRRNAEGRIHERSDRG